MATITATVGGAITTKKMTVNGNISAKSADIAGDIRRNSAPQYTGPYEFTPTKETQIIEAAGKAIRQDIIINPIPSSYGLVSWNGTALTIS